MAAHPVSKKKILLRGLISFCAALAAAVLMNRLLSGPRLGPHYDYLMSFRPPPPVSREVLIIDTGTGGPVLSAEGNIVHPLAAAQLITALIEMDAGALIIQAPVLGVSAAGNEEELLLRFDEEYELLGRNIRNLFEAIRMGFIAPGEADRYVEDLISLTGRGKERLIAALVRQDETGLRRFEDAAARFGRVIIPGDLRIRINRSAPGNGPGPEERAEASLGPGNAAAAAGPGIYSRSRPDPEGVLRRIAPVLRSAGGETEHAVYAALKLVPGERRGFSIVYTEFGPALSYRVFPSPLSGETGEAAERLIPLDSGGALLVEKPGPGALRKISLADLLAYEEADRELRRMLGEAEDLGIYQGLEPGAYPGVLYDHALSLRKTLIGEGGDRGAWIDARRRYFRALDRFFADTPDEAGGAVASLRARYAELAELRTRLEEALAFSFCILGSAPSSREGNGGESGAPDQARPRPGISGRRAGALPSDAEASAILANSIITARAIVPGSERHIFFWSLGAALLLLILIRKTGPLLSLGIGFGFLLLTAAAFSLSFIFSSCWIDPLIPLAACAAGTGVSVCCALFVKENAAGLIRGAYGAHVSPEYLKVLVRRRRPLPSETVLAESAVVAVKNLVPIPRHDPLAASAETARFRDRVFNRFARAGGVLAGFEGDLVFIAFGSPLERNALLGMRLPFGESFAVKAAGFIFDLLQDSPEAASWHFGVDAGECAFSYSPASGYRAAGYPVIRARILANLASRYNAQALVTRVVSEKLDTIPIRKLDVLADQESGEKEMFYELLVKRRDSGRDRLETM
ncbi:MAG: hypothetical protein LBQ14_09050 [Treponema sp.]|jgi:hypothetical protein|nr:hypothetical protein [Treponema sp.]